MDTSNCWQFFYSLFVKKALINEYKTISTPSYQSLFVKTKLPANTQTISQFVFRRFMDIISPLQLWKDFDRHSLGLDVNYLYTREVDGYRITALYFSVLRVDDGVVRAYARLYTPIHAPTAPIIVYFNDIFKSIESRSSLREALEDYAFLCIDYAGKHDDRERFTIYPKSLEKLNYFTYPETPFDIPDEAKLSARYLWTAMAMRAVTLIESEFTRARGMGIVGVGLGGCPAIMSCCFEPKFSAVMTFYSVGQPPYSSTRQSDFTAFKVALDCESYAPHVKAPLLIEITSNERDGSMDYMNDIYQSVTDQSSRFCIVERTSRSVSVKHRKNCKFWFDYHINKEGAIPNSPEIKAFASEARLYIETLVDKSLEVESLELFVSQGMENSAYRNWEGFRMEMISEVDYLAKIPVYDVKAPLFAFVNVKYKNAVSLSSNQITLSPEKMGVKGDEIKPSRLIYDSEMGLDDWTLLNDSGTDDNIKLSMETGPFDIMGVSSSLGSIATFKINEKIYKSFKDSSLQMLIYSPVPQDVIFKIAETHEDGQLKEYSCTRKLAPTDNWSTVTLNAIDFKSASGSPASFEDVVIIEIISKAGRVLISSMLWV